MTEIDEQLFNAIVNNDIVKVKFLLNQGANFKTVKRHKYESFEGTPMLWAIYEGHLEIMQYLLNQGASLQEKSWGGRGEGPLIIAAERGHIKIVEDLLNRGISIEESDQYGRSALTIASGTGNVEMVKYLLGRGASINRCGKYYYDMPIFSAAKAGYVQLVEYLFSQGASLKSVEKDGYKGTLLIECALTSSRCFDVIQYLISQGANVNETSSNGDTALMAAARNNLISILEFLIRHGAIINAINNKGETALHQAASSGRLKAIQCLLNKEANIKSKDNSGKTALLAAASHAVNNFFDVLKYLLNQGASLKEVDNDGNTALLAYAGSDYGDDSKVINYLLSQGANLKERNKEGNTVLLLAASSGKLKLIKYLITEGANVKETNEAGNNALMLAAIKGKLDVVKYLVHLGLDPNSPNKKGETALAVPTNSNVANYLKNRHTAEENLLVAAQFGNLPQLQQLLRQNMNLLTTNSLDNALVQLAVDNGQTAIVQCLVEEANIDPTLKKEKGYYATSLHIVARYNYLELMQYLIEKAKLSPALANEDYETTALLVAVNFCHLNIIKYLLSHGSSLKEKDKNQRTSLLIASEKNDLELVRYLLSQGASLQEIDEWGNTPLLIAARNGQLELVQFFIEQGANPQKKNKQGHTALLYTIYFMSNEYIVNNEHFNIAKYLLSHGASVKEKGEDGYTPLLLAAFLGNLELVKYLLEKGATLDETNKQGKNALDLAIIPFDNHLGEQFRLIRHGGYWKNPKTVDYLKMMLKQHTQLRDAFHQAVKANDLNQTQALSQQGVNLLSVTDDEENTPLHWAVHYGHKELVKWLISKMQQNQLPLTQPNKDGKTAADLAQAKSDLRDLFQVPSSSVECTHSAFSSSETAALSNASNDLVNKVLIAAAKKGRLEKVAEFLQQGVNINAQNSKGWTALHYAARKGYIEVVKLLLQAQADISLKTNKGNTAYDFAVKKNQVEIVKLLAPSEQQHQFTSNRPSPNEQEVGKPIIPPAEKPVPPSPQLDSFQITYSQLTFEKELGKGGFGVVFKGTWRFNDVAIKQLHLSNPSPDTLADFQQEMHIMAKLRSPNIIQLYGVCTQQAPYCIVMEYMNKGSLYHVLHSNIEISWPQREKIASDIACGLAFLHAENILHRDLKSLNVLLDENFKAKLCDFGLAKLKSESSSQGYTQSVGTLAWMAPEVLPRRAKFTPQSDVYSYGMTLWEIAARERPFKDAPNQDILRGWIRDGEREDIPPETPPKLAKLIKWCWEATPEQRPTAAQAIMELKADKNEVQDLQSGPTYRDNSISGVNSAAHSSSNVEPNISGYRSNFHSFKS